jgi:dienelactone hydrolase
MDVPTRRPSLPHQDADILDPGTKRTIRLRIRLPASEGPAPLIVYSPGLGSGLGNGAAWCEKWQQAGYAVVTLAHPVTDEGIWDTSRRSFRANLAAALAHEQYALRVMDCRFAIRHCIDAPGIGPHIDASRIGIAGHSYGALTVQALAREPRDLAIRAAIAFSPGARSPVAARQMVMARLPFFCVTGDRDNHVTFRKDGDARTLGVPLRNRRAVYENLPRGSKQLLVLSPADHMSFAGESVDPHKFSRDVADPDRSDADVWQRAAKATTLFWRHYLEPEPGAAVATYLETLKTGLLPADRFESA